MKKAMWRFDDKVALVTGGSRGIGLAVAEAFVRAGAKVVVNHRKNRGSSSAAVAAFCEKYPERAKGMPADISSKPAVVEMFEQAAGAFGRLDALILNAAMAPFKPYERLLERDLRQLVETNFLGNIFCMQQALPLLEKTGGNIVFMSSLGSRFYTPSYPLGSMKAAMETAVRDWSESFRKKGVRVNGVCGGLVNTDSFKVLRQHLDILRSLPEDLLISPEEMAQPVLFLCSPAAEAIRGQILVADKGLGNSLYGLERLSGA